MPNVRLAGLPNPHSYDTQTPGVVVDRVTGLIWQRKLTEKFYTFQQAEGLCDRLELAGHRDWRLPSRIELVSLLDTTRIQPSIVGVIGGRLSAGGSGTFTTVPPSSSSRANHWFSARSGCSRASCAQRSRASDSVM